MLAAPQGSSPREPPFPLNKHPYPWGQVQPKGSGCLCSPGSGLMVLGAVPGSVPHMGEGQASFLLPDKGT